jgi:hypothetical protein
MAKIFVSDVTGKEDESDGWETKEANITTNIVNDHSTNEDSFSFHYHENDSEEDIAEYIAEELKK